MAGERMLFNSVHFLIFFPLVVALYFSIRPERRWMLLLLSSYYFYMSWRAEYALLIIISTLVDYFAGMRIYEAKERHRKRLYLFSSLMMNLTLLFSFKYFNFFSESAREFLSLFSLQFDPFMLNVILPVGISFYTFQTLSYTIDIYRGKLKPERHLGIFAVYVAFFPQLVAGPIERARNLLPQFFEKHRFEYKRATDGLKLMVWGFFKKVVIADRLALLVNVVYNDPTSYSGFPLTVATVFFAFQIYCDFSGYSDIAIGAAQIMGYRLMDNFRRPYLSKSIAEFWKRWHISLSTWFRDYLYIPLGGNQVRIPRWHFNIMATFLISGLWHGANWTFVAWGALHGLYYLVEARTQGIRGAFVKAIGLAKLPRIHNFVSIVVTFILADIAWIFFRANSIGDATYILTHLTSNFNLSLAELPLYSIGFTSGFLIAIGSIVFMEAVHLMQEHRGMRQMLSARPLAVRWAVYMALVLGILLFGVFGSNEFIYFQF